FWLPPRSMPDRALGLVALSRANGFLRAELPRREGFSQTPVARTRCGTPLARSRLVVVIRAGPTPRCLRRPPACPRLCRSAGSYGSRPASEGVECRSILPDPCASDCQAGPRRDEATYGFPRARAGVAASDPPFPRRDGHGPRFGWRVRPRNAAVADSWSHAIRPQARGVRLVG